jgi:alpha-L-arabinofuranosidase
MNTARPILQQLSVLVALTFPGLCFEADAQPTSITIQAGQPGKPISPHLIGIFFEDLNYAADGGFHRARF